MNREQKIAALAACPFNPVKSLKALQALSDEELATLEERTAAAKAATEKATADATALTAAQAQITALSAAPKPMTEAEWLNAAPAHVRDRFAAMKASDDAEAAQLVTKLAAAQTSFAEAELKDMPLPQLRKLAAAVIKTEPAADFSAAGVPVPHRAAGDFRDLSAFEPPDPYAGATKQ